MVPPGPIPTRDLALRSRPVGLRFLKTVFPLETLGHEWVPERTPEGAERSGALAAKRRVVRTGSRGTIVSTGKLIEFG